MKLRLEYEIIDYPYTEEPFNGVWSKITLKILNDNKLEKVIFDLQWDILPFLNWFADNKKSILNDELLLIGSESIAYLINRFYYSLDESLEWDESDYTLIDIIYHYRETHDVGFALKGTDVRGILIGLKKNVYTISNYQGSEKWEYEINIKEYYNQLEEIVLKDPILSKFLSFS